MSGEWQGISIEDAARLIVMPADITPAGAAMAAMGHVAQAADSDSGAGARHHVLAAWAWLDVLQQLLGAKPTRHHVLAAWAWLDVLQQLLGAKPSTLGRPCGSPTLAGAAHSLRLCRHYALLWCRDHWPDETNREAVWTHLGDARESLRAWWEAQP